MSAESEVTTSVARLGRSREVAAELRVLVLAGIPAGVVVAGVGSRLAMLLLRLTSPDTVVGVQSDDGFTIGRFTISGTYTLLVLGAMVGVIGAAAYQWVRPWLLGPVWFRHATVGAAAGAVVGSMLVHADGIDFIVLEPMWLAVGLFVALPVLTGVSVAVAVEWVERHDANRDLSDRRTWIVPVLLVAAFPFTLMIVVPAVIVLVWWVAIRDAAPIRRLASHPGTRLVVSAAWSSVAVLGLVALIDDVRQLRDLA